MTDNHTFESLPFNSKMITHFLIFRYVCEIAATPVELLTQSEITSLLLFQTQSSQPESGKAKYDEAVRLGVLSRNPAVCQKRYATCPVIKKH